jgi:hypothetical protein
MTDLHLTFVRFVESGRQKAYFTKLLDPQIWQHAMEIRNRRPEGGFDPASAH